ncbi:hypothetical protein GCM10010518_55100 [Kitasatospora cinereorecta]
MLSRLKPGDSCLPRGSGLDALRAPDDCPPGSRDEREAHPVQVPFRPALWSALPDQPQPVFLHTNTAWLSRLPGVVTPQAEQRLEVPGAGTLCRVPPSWAGGAMAG